MPIGEKTWVAPTGHRTVLQLQGISYQIKLIYLGNDRVAHDANYRCKFELQRGNATIATIPSVIGNRVSGETEDEDAIQAATPAPAGDTRNPPGDEMFRVMIDDQHALKASDNNTFLGRGGDTRSKTDGYRTNNWLRDVSPAVPFRIIVRRLRGFAPVDINGDEKVVLEIKDPVEEFAQNDGLRRQFLEKYFNRFNRTSANPDVGDDNAEVPVDGVRPSGDSSKAVDVFKVAPYTAPPEVEIAPVGHNNVAFSSLSAATPHETKRIILTLTAVQENGVNIGIADPVFTPWPAGGDNYRFLLKVVDGGGADVRDQVVDGAEVQLFDHNMQQIPKPRAYVTGRFVIWRRIKFALVVLVDNLSQNNIAWADMRNRYAKAFVDLVVPPNSVFHSLSLAQWRTELRREFDPGGTNANFNNPANFTPVLYNQGVFPPFLQPTATVANIENMAKAIIRHGCGQVNPAINPTPDVDTQQDNLPGLFMVLYKLSAPLPGGVIGSSFGNRSFWFAQGSSVTDTTWTVTHELGHSLYLRHSHTDQSNFFNYRDSGGAVTSVNLVRPGSNNNVADHDQADAFNCIMAYTSPVNASPCGMCALTLRFYDRVAVTSAFRNTVFDGQRQAHVVELGVVGGNAQLDETVTSISLSAANPKALLAVSRVTPYVTRGGTNQKGVVNMTSQGAPPLSAWTKSGAGDVSLSIVNGQLRARPTRAGQVTLNFSLNGVTASATFNVTAP